jgi:hypothetical protein
MQSFKKPGDGLGGLTQKDPLKIKPLGIKTPDVHDSLKLSGVKDLLDELEEEEERDAKNKEMEEEEKQERARERAARRKRLLCCCGVRGCSIGPMTGTYEE